MPLGPVQANDGDTFAIQRPTQAPPHVTQGWVRHFQPANGQDHPKLSSGEPLPRAEQLEQLAPDQSAVDDVEQRAPLPTEGSEQDTEGPFAVVLIEPWT